MRYDRLLSPDGKADIGFLGVLSRCHQLTAPYEAYRDGGRGQREEGVGGGTSFPHAQTADLIAS